MIPAKPLPFKGGFASADDYVASLLDFVYTTDMFQILCGGTHILDFFTSQPGLFHTALPAEWHPFLLQCDTMRLLDILLRDDLDNLDNLELDEGLPRMPESLRRYVRSIRDLSLGRDFAPSRETSPPALSATLRVGMKPKKIHEVTHFAAYVDRLSRDVCGEQVTHFVDFGSGQNYLGRTLASEPYNRRVVAVEGRENNVAAARGLDVSSGLASKQKVMRNKKLWNKILQAGGPDPHGDPDALADALKQLGGADGFDFRPREQLGSDIAVQDGKGYVQYISGRLDSGDLSDVLARVDSGGCCRSPKGDSHRPGKRPRLTMMAMSIHSCGNLSHHAIRSLVLNPDIRAVAVVGCCYNLMTEKLGPPSYRHAYLRPTLDALNGRVGRESSRFDPQGFPMSRRFTTYANDGIRLNVTARMMACQAPRNWGRVDSEAFFSRHFYRAVLQKMFLDRGVVKQIHHRKTQEDSSSPLPSPANTKADGTHDAKPGPFDTSTQPVTIGGLRKPCYASLRAYVRGCIEKLTTSAECRQYADVMNEKMAGITDEEIDAYEAEFLPRKKELSVIWSLMACSAMVVESLIITDRWMFLKEQPEVKDAWVETVFDYGQSPRNMVVVGVKTEDKTR
ncbi:uncharacterized protein UV8b_06947 [Ustilaginoidea virens]|uniref:Methyltransferase domain-containing protein n=1 Tax=Ustilaginoidea virens TaxID=1159556 RepID=A0A063C6T2_USTVR|nr:uncharacterized protein UV8b_06947 [Ustilaginoidea virens]QUC22706.1 hypothetical protein UV8b_06947 [Ustilaginoidea virens]GAO16467.1 hypothetical protein UVI_02011220 [Ustilaginoidea virens]